MREPREIDVETIAGEEPAAGAFAETARAAETAPPAAGDAQEISELLEKTSRTFALAIPFLPEPTRLQVGVAYLLFRIADTFEDAERWPRRRRIDALNRFGRLLADPEPEAVRTEVASWLADPPCDHSGYLELLAKTSTVLAAFQGLGEVPRRLVGDHTRRTIEGMAHFVARADEEGHLQLADLDDLRAYCYVVAGIVGEMLTELFLLGRQALHPVRAFLRRRSARFGEALQLVNIIKDSLADATYGRRFLPAACDLEKVIALARRDLEIATRYVLRLQRAGAPRGIVAFTALPIRLAKATLDLIEDRGVGAKLGRPEVLRIVESLNYALDQGLPTV